MEISTLITLLFGAGAGGAVSGLITLVRTWRQGKAENEETLIRRLDEDNKKQSEARRAAEQRADEAEAEATKYRRALYKAQDQAALYRRELMVNNIAIPEVGE